MGHLTAYLKGTVENPVRTGSEEENNHKGVTFLSKMTKVIKEERVCV